MLFDAFGLLVNPLRHLAITQFG